MTRATEPLVRFVVGGAQKAGTSALVHYMRRHPALCLPQVKEAHVFDAPDFDDGWTPSQVDLRYAGRFGTCADGALHGDATPFYLVHPRVVERIARYNPAMRWIVLLRDPAERALSQFHMERSRGKEQWPLWLALLLERWRLRGHRDDFAPTSPLRRHSYRLRGDYAGQLDVLLTRFPRSQVLLLTNRELRGAPSDTLRKVCEFLGVTPLPHPLETETVFSGDYSPLPSASVRMRMLRWWLRDEIRAVKNRYGIDFST